MRKGLLGWAVCGGKRGVNGGEEGWLTGGFGEGGYIGVECTVWCGVVWYGVHVKVLYESAAWGWRVSQSGVFEALLAAYGRVDACRKLQRD